MISGCLSPEVGAYRCQVIGKWWGKGLVFSTPRWVFSTSRWGKDLVVSGFTIMLHHLYPLTPLTPLFSFFLKFIKSCNMILVTFADRDINFISCTFLKVETSSSSLANYLE